MYTKYIILFCLTYYYIPTVISFDEATDFEKWFNEIRKETEDYITFKSLSKTYGTYEVDELQYVMGTYGVVFTGKNCCSERRLYFDKFKVAAMEGIIHRYHTMEMANYFLSIIEKGAKRGYIIQSDLVRHYENKIPTSQIDTVMATFGTAKPDGMRLSFFGFRRAINTGGIPAWL